MNDDVLFKCAIYYGRAETDQDFATARSVLAECLVRSFVEGVPKYPIRVTQGFDSAEWRNVTEAALSICSARTWPEDEDITIPVNQLKAAGKRWSKIARWTPEPWMVRR